MKEWKECPDCTCPFFSISSHSTADMPHPWQDTDEKWYIGCLKETRTKTCLNCGRSQKIVYIKGKLESIK